MNHTFPTRALFALLHAATFLFACQNGPSEDPGQNTTPEEQPTEKPLPTDGIHTYTERDLDSLRFTYNFKMENALYVITKHDRSAVNVLPVEPWEKLLTRGGAFYNPEEIIYNNCKVHRKEYAAIQTSGKPVDLQINGDKATIFIPFDGNTASALKTLKENHPDAKLGLVANDAITAVIEDWSAISNQGLRLTDLSLEAAELLRDAFTLVPEDEETN